MARVPGLEASIEKEAFRQVLGQFATGVTVVTTATGEGLSGLTVNSFTSVSLDPPLVLVCVDLTSQTLPCLRASGYFAVNVLTGEQEALARCFASRSGERYEQFCRARSSWRNRLPHSRRNAGIHRSSDRRRIPWRRSRDFPGASGRAGGGGAGV
jgi:flavin reductase (DIM6/NTAB) family NADH-FMN oxidoreductase RutF